MKLLKIIANNYRNCIRGFSIDFLRSTDKLNCYNICTFAGKTASGKTTVLEFIDICYSILSDFHVDTKYFDVTGAELVIYFYYENYIYKYSTELSYGNEYRIFFKNQRIYRKEYNGVSDIYSEDGFKELFIEGELPDDTSTIFFILKRNITRGVYIGGYDKGEATYKSIFSAMKKYKISDEVLSDIVNNLDKNIENLSMLDNYNYKLRVNGSSYILSAQELWYRLSGGTTRGMLLYIYVYASLAQGFTLLVDEIENHLQRETIENILMLYRNKDYNSKGAALMFTTNYLELWDQLTDKKWLLENRDGNTRIQTARNIT